MDKDLLKRIRESRIAQTLNTARKVTGNTINTARSIASPIYGASKVVSNTQVPKTISRDLAYTVQNPREIPSIFKKRVIDPPVKFSQMLGEAAATPYTNKLFEQTQQQNRANADLYTQRAIDLRKQGDAEGANRFFSAAQNTLSRSSLDAGNRASQMAQNRQDTLTSGIGTANVAGMLYNPTGALTSTVGGGLLGSGIEAAMGNTQPGGFYRGVDNMSKYAGFVNMSNPVIAGVTGKIAPETASPVVREVISRTSNAIGNLLEDRGLSALYGEETSIAQDLTSLGIGFIIGKQGSKQDYDNLTKQLTTFGLQPRDQKAFVDIVKKAKSRLPEGAMRLEYAHNGQNRSMILSKQDASDWTAYLQSQGVQYKLSDLGYQGGFIGGMNATSWNDHNVPKFSSRLDQKPRFEIDDSGAKLTKAAAERNFFYPDVRKGVLSEYIDHPKLFEQYPQLKDAKVSFVGTSDVMGDGSRAAYDPKTNRITVNTDWVSRAKNEDIKSTLLHEIQHAIQEIEGFARGGSPSQMRTQSFDIKRARLDKEMVDLQNKLKTLDPGSYDYFDTQSRIWKIENDLLNPEVSKKDAFTGYQRLSGELEARAVQRRMNMTPEQRLGTDPYFEEMKATGTTNPNDYITRFDSGVQASQPTKGVEAPPAEKARLRTKPPAKINTKVERGFSETVRTSKYTSPQLRADVYSDYNPKSNKILVEQANQQITYNPNDARRKILAEPATDENVAIAGQLIKLHDVKGEYDIAGEIADNMARKLTEAGRAIQAASLYNKLSPEGVRMYAKRISDGKIPNDVAANLSKQAVAIKKLPDGSIEQQIAIHEMMESIARYKPQSTLDKVMSFWKAGLLTAPTTTGGNILGNTARNVGEGLVRIPATMLDTVLSTFTGKRTRALTARGILSGMKEGAENGVRYFKTGFDPRRDPLSKFDSQAVYFSNSRAGRYAENYVNGVFRLMGAQDQPFYYAAFRNSIAEQAKVEAINQGIKGNKLQQFRKAFEQNPPEKALETADEVARYAVFQNKTVLSEVASGLGNVTNPVGRFLVNFIAPFRGVPSAVATSVWEWSPTGFISSAKKITDAMQGKGFDQRGFVDQVSRAGLGTFGVMSLGSFLHDRGLLTLDYPTNENERKLWISENKQPFSVKIGGSWRSLNYVQPYATTLAMGGEMNRAKQEGESADTAFYRGMAMGAKALTEQSFLSGVSGSIQAMQDPSRYGERFVEQTAGSVVPNFIRKGSSAFDTMERKVSGPAESFLSATPARGKLMTRKDMFGQPVANTVGMHEFIDPTRSQKANESDPLINELRRLQDSGFGVTPPRITKKESFPGVGEIKITEQQIDQLEQMIGPEIQSRWNEFIASPVYSQLSDEDREKELRNISTNVRTAVKAKYLETMQPGSDPLSKLSKKELAIYKTIGRDQESTQVGRQDVDFAHYMYGLENIGSPPSDRFGFAKWEDEAYNGAIKILADEESVLTEEEKIASIEALGLDPENVMYYEIAKENNDLKLLYIKDEIESIQRRGGTREAFINFLIDSRKEVNGEQILAPGVIDDLRKEGYITSAEAKSLKDIAIGSTGTRSRKSSGGSSDYSKKTMAAINELFENLKRVKIESPSIRASGAPSIDVRGLTFQ